MSVFNQVLLGIGLGLSPAAFMTALVLYLRWDERENVGGER